MQSACATASLPAEGAVNAGLPLWRRVIRGTGLQRKLVLSFGLLMLLAEAVTFWLFVARSSETLSDILGEQARQISQTLAAAAQAPCENRDVAELHRLGRMLLASRNIVLVVFCDAANQPLAAVSRDPAFTVDHWRQYFHDDQTPQRLMQVYRRQMPSLGEFLQVTAPVLSVLPEAAGRQTPREANTRLLGYLTVGVSQAHELKQLNRATLISLAVGGLVFILSVPLAMAAVHRIFLPIRQLVTATNRIAAGDYSAQVATDRRDEIGMLARSFNEMVRRIHSQQQQLRIANENLAEANRSLEQKVQQRTSELEAANRRLSAEIAEKEDFLRAVSHDLNAPLRNISGMAALLLMKYRDRFDEEIVHRLERIRKNVEIESDLIAELLELSRIKTRRQKMEPVDIETLLRDLAGMFENDLRQRNITLFIHPPMPVLHCERNRMRQVFQNLIDNAIKYMGNGPLREIHIGCAETPEGVEFYVRDTGMGIHPDDLGKVFYVFRRGRNSAEMNVAGKGVGLASVKSIIETYNGRIWVESEHGKGCTFRFTIHRQFVPSLAATRPPEAA